MNILYLCDEYPPGRYGGIGTSVQLLARQMVKMGHRVVVAGLYSPGYGGADEFDDEGVKVFRYRWRTDNLLKDEFALGTRILKNAFKVTRVLDRDIKASLATFGNKLEDIITRYQIDIIEMPDYNDYIRHCRGYIPFPTLSVPVVVKMNGSITYFNREAHKPVPANIFKMEQGIVDQAVAIAAVSRYTAGKSKGYFNYANGIVIIPNGIDTRIVLDKAKIDPNQVIFTGTLVEKKGVYQLAKAWNIVHSQMPRARLLILGKGDQKKIAALLENRAAKTVTFRGHVHKEYLYKHLVNSAVAVFPSYAEAFALAPLEAMACGTAVINSNRTSGPELIKDGINGLLCDPDDVQHLASVILQLLNDPQKRDELVLAGNKTVKERFDIAIIAQQNITFYAEVLSKQNKGYYSYK